MAQPVAGGTSTTIATWDPQTSDDAYALAVDASHVYYSADGLWRVPISGGTPEHLVATRDANGAIALDATALYFADGGIMRLAL